MKLFNSLALIAAMLTITAAPVAAQQDGSAAKPYRVTLIPADGGTEDGTRKDFQPVFDAVAKTTGMNFDIKVGQSYGAVVEAICADVTEIAWFGAASYLPAREKGCAELLAVDVHHGSATYYSGIFKKTGAPINAVADLKGRRMAFGDVNSTSSFGYPVAMMLKAGLDPARDLTEIRMTGSHANSLKALQEGLVDAAAASFDSYEKAVNQGAIKAGEFEVVAKSEPIPNPPLAMSTKLPAEVKKKLRDAFNTVHTAGGVTPEMVRGYGGKKVDRYDATVTDEALAPAIATLAKVTPEIKAAMIEKGSKK